NFSAIVDSFLNVVFDVVSNFAFCSSVVSPGILATTYSLTTLFLYELRILSKPFWLTYIIHCDFVTT
ncbi:hypothetical protein ACJONP_05630, partial [Mycoplasmopsis synoviae]